MKIFGRFFTQPAAFFAAAVLLGCSETQKAKCAFETVFGFSIENVGFSAQVALSDAEKSQGLMFRESLAPNSGMFFVYDSGQQMSYWMKNTKIPLDIGFFTQDGTLTEVKKLYPHNLDAVKSSRSDIFYCLEMNAGWFEKNGIFPPAKLDMQKLEKAVGERK